jgi:hypothetical protein
MEKRGIFALGSWLVVENEGMDADCAVLVGEISLSLDEQKKKKKWRKSNPHSIALFLSFPMLSPLTIISHKYLSCFSPLWQE